MIEEEQLEFRITLLRDLKLMSKNNCDPVQIAASWQTFGTGKYPQLAIEDNTGSNSP